MAQDEYIDITSTEDYLRAKIALCRYRLHDLEHERHRLKARQVAPWVSSKHFREMQKKVKLIDKEIDKLQSELIKMIDPVEPVDWRPGDLVGEDYYAE